MKRKVLRILGVVLVLTLAFMLVACDRALVKSEMEINSTEGAGTKVIRVSILRDHKYSQADQDAGKTNSAFFPMGQQAVVDFFETVIPDGVELEWTEEADEWVYTFTYSFADIEEYNAMTKALVTEGVWDSWELEEATLDVVEVEGGHEVTFTEMTRILEASIHIYFWYLHQPDQSDIFDPTRNGVDPDGFSLGQNYKVASINITVGDNSDLVDSDMQDLGAFEESTFSVTGFFAAEVESSEPAVETPIEDENPETTPGDAGMAGIIAITLISGASLLAGKKRSK